MLPGHKMVGLIKIPHFRHYWHWYSPTSEKKKINNTHLKPKIGLAVISAIKTAGKIKPCANHFFKTVY